jgi:hypothetical protein
VLTDDGANTEWASLSDAIEALRDDLAKAWWDGKNQRVRFKVEPVELTVQVGVTKTGEGSAGIKWHILTLGGQRKHETATTQVLKLRLQPVVYGADGRRLPREEQLINDRDDDTRKSVPRHKSDQTLRDPE